MKKLESITPLQFKNEDSTTATTEVRLGDIVETLTFNSSDDGCRISKGRLEYIEQAGVVIDYTSLIATYNNMVANQEEIIKQAKIVKFKMEYSSIWTNTETFAKVDGVTYQRLTLDEYVQKRLNSIWFKDVSLKMFYDGNEISVSRERGKYVIDGTMTNYRERKYTTLSNCAKMFVKLVEKKKTDAQFEVDLKLRETKHIESTLETLKNLFGNVTHDMVWKRSLVKRGNGYYVNRYYIKEANYTNEIESNADYTRFTYGSFHGLTSTQVLAMMEILKTS